MAKIKKHAAYAKKAAGGKKAGGSKGGAGGGAGAGSQGGSSHTEVRSPTSTSTEAETVGNITVTGGAGRNSPTTVHVMMPGGGKKLAKSELAPGQQHAQVAAANLVQSLYGKK